MAVFNHTNPSQKCLDHRWQRMENLLQITLPNTMGSRFWVLEGWKRKKKLPPINTDERR